MKKTMALAGITMLFVAGLLLLPGCRNAVTPTPTVPGTGTVTVGFGDQIFRTILPDTVLTDFERFDLVLTPVPTGTAIEIDDWDENPINIPEGTWNLAVTAFLLDPDYYYDPDPPASAFLVAARGNTVGTPSANFPVYTGLNTNVTVHLTPIDDLGYYGTFSWEIYFDSSIDAAVMRIYGTNVPAGFENFNLLAQPASLAPVPWPVGIFQVFVDLENGNGEAPTIGPIVMRVYRNLESVFDEDFTLAYFPRTLFDMIMAAWEYDNTGEWDFAGAGITSAHFGLLGIVVYSDLDDLIYYLDILTVTHVPANAGELSALIDAAEISFAAPDFTVFMTQAEAEEDLEDMVYDYLNDSALTFAWVQGATTYTVTVGVGSVYEVVFTFNRITGTVTITNAAATGYTVGDVLTADLTNLGGTGTADFQWLRRVEYPTPAAAATPITGAMSATYTLVAADANNVIYVRVRRAGYFGFALSAATGIVEATDGTGTITITFQDWNGITPITGPAPFSITYASPPSITLGQAGVTGITWHLRGTQVGTGDTITLDADVHDNWVGTQVLTVRGYIGGRLYSALVSFTTTL